MKKTGLIVLMLWLASWLAALAVFSPDTKLIQMPLEELRKTSLTSFETRRDKDGAVITETWEGIPLLAWLQSNVSTNWQNLKVQSNDAYIVNFSRFELSDNNFFLALKQNGRELNEYDIRVIHIPSRENAWVRNLAFLKLEDFLPCPQPQQIFLLENWLKQQNSWLKDGALAFADLLPKAFSLESAELVFMDSRGRKLRMNYPRDLAKAELKVDAGGELRLDLGKKIPAGFAEEQRLKEIVYLQAGALAVIDESMLSELPILAKELGWDSEQLYIVKAKRKPVSAKGLQRKNLAEGWLELR